MIIPALTDTFAALGDPTRFAIVESLLETGEQPAEAIQDSFDLSAPAVSPHLKVLREADIISQRKLGKQRLYAIKPDAIQAINDWAISYQTFWSGRLDQLAASLGKDSA